MACKFHYKGKTYNTAAEVSAALSVNDSTVKKENNLKPKNLTDKIIQAETSRLPNDMVGIVTDRLAKAFPNLTFIKTNDTDPNNLFVNERAYIHNGSVFLNTDKLNVASPLHEISHIFLYVMKYVHPDIYSGIMTDVKSILKDNPDIDKLLRGNLSDLTGEMFFEEVASRIMGWTDIGELSFDLTNLKVQDVGIRNTSLMARISDIVKRFFTYVKQTLNGLFNVDFDIDLGKTTIVDYAVRLSNAINSGKIVSRISSYQVQTLMNINNATRLNESPLYKPLTSTEALQDKLMNSRDQLLYKNIKDEEVRINYLLTEIENRNGFLPKSELGFTADLRDMTRAERREYIVSNNITSLYNKYSSTLRERVVEWLSPKYGGKISELGALGLDKELNKNIYEDNAGIMIKEQMDYHSSHMVMSLSDFKSSYPDIKFDDYFNDMGVTVSVEHTSDDQILISLYHIGTKNPKNERAPGMDKRYILDAYGIDAKKSKQLGINLENNADSIQNVNLVLLANNLRDNNTKIRVRQVGNIGLTTEQSHPGFLNYYAVVQNIKKMGKVEPFVKSLPDALQGYFTGDKEMHTMDISFDKIFETLLDNIEQIAGFEYKIRNTRDMLETSTIGEKKKWMSLLLNDLVNKANITSEDRWMITMLKDAIVSIGKFYVPINEMNTTNDMSAIDKFFKSIIHMGEEPIQEISKVVRATSMKIVREVNDFKREFEPIMKWYKENNYSSSSNNYRDAFATVKIKDHLGNITEREIGWLYWTNDEKEDTVFGKQAKEKGISKELLDKNRWIVDKLTNQLVDDLQHRLEINGKMFNKETRKYFTKEEIREKLFNEYGYKKGMLPIMPKTTMEQMSKGKVGKVIKKQVLQAKDTFTIYDELADSTGDKLDGLTDMFLGQLLNIGAHTTTKYGPQERLTVLGITYNKFGNNGNGEFEIIDDKQLSKNQNMSHDLETIMNYYMMSSKRKIYYETEALPIYNAMKIVLSDMKNSKGLLNKDNILDTLDMFMDRAVFGKAKIKGITIAGVDVLPAIQLSSSIVGSVVLMLNVNTGILSTGINGIRAWTQAFANISSDKFGPTDLVWATGAIWPNIAKVMQLLYDFQLMNMSEFELITMNLHKITGKNPLAQEVTNFTNWASDALARGILLMAQMHKDGTWNAVDYNKESGKVTYDMSKDERYKDMTHGRSIARFNAIKEQLVIEGHMNESDVSLTRAYADVELQSILYDASVIVGRYDNIGKANSSNLFVGRLFLMFKNYLVTAAQDAIHEGKWIDNAGQLVIKEIKGENGINYVAQWERPFIEGYVKTILRHAGQLVRGKGIDKMTASEKANYRKLITRVAIFVLMYMIWAGLGGDDKGKKAEDRKNIMPDLRILKNWKYIYQSIFILPQIAEVAQKPFAFISILTRWFDFSTMKKLENTTAEDYIPSQITTFTEIGSEDTNN